MLALILEKEKQELILNSLTGGADSKLVKVRRLFIVICPIVHNHSYPKTWSLSLSTTAAFSHNT